MTNLEFENMAVRIVKTIPEPEATFEELKKKKSIRKRKTVFSFSGNKRRVFAAVPVMILVIALGISVYAGQTGNGMWAFYRASSTYLSEFDLELPEQLAAASMSEKTQWLKIVPHGISWREALANPLYTVASVAYYLDNSETYCDVSIGTTKNAYWKSYFSYVDDVWTPNGSTGGSNSYSYGTVQTEQYEGITLYFSQMTKWGPAYENGSASDVIVTWMDSENNICMNLCLFNSADMDAALSCAKEIIKMNN
ncbi:MAG: hypothetical protein LUG99_03170 [Lachnospiraceae bacterium]|nr:hypothetical protein [Lachnospiraceae bacterium]